MKRLLLALVLCLLVGAVGATSLNFQDAGDFTPTYIENTTGVRWSHSGVGGNSFLDVYPGYGSGATSDVNTSQPNQFTYAAFTMTRREGYTDTIRLLDVNKGTIWESGWINRMSGTLPIRYEINIVGGTVYLYQNGLFLQNSTPISVNPSYFSYHQYNDCCSGTSSYLDDWVIGDTENKYILGGPEESIYILKKDFVTPASSGFAYAANQTTISSTNMTTTWSKSNITYSGNETIQLLNVDTGVVYANAYTGVKATGSQAWDVSTAIFNSGAPYGRYYATIAGSGAYSDEIWYLGSGATISFDKSDYSGQDTAMMTYNILGAYWDPSTYSYSIDVVSGTTGATMQSTAISSSSGTEDYTFTSTDPLGVYYAIVKATKLSDSSVIWMNYDYAELSSYVTIQGYINDAETGLPISGANINITQNGIINNLTTIADGNYTATNHLSGAAITINATAPLHRQYTYSFTPLSAQTINLNITLTNITPTVAGLGIGGVARDTAYGRPLASVSVWVINTTNAETNTKTTSMTGWYLCDEGTTCFLTTKRPYDVWGEKAGYSNSANATAVAA